MTKYLAIIVAQLVEQTPQIRGLNPNNGQIVSTNRTLNTKDKNKGKEVGNGPSKKVKEYFNSFLQLCPIFTSVTHFAQSASNKSQVYQKKSR